MAINKHILFYNTKIAKNPPYFNKSDYYKSCFYWNKHEIMGKIIDHTLS